MKAPNDLSGSNGYQRGCEGDFVEIISNSSLEMSVMFH